ncbi:hypothetical protein JXJ21_09665 [candidate division KSB1 bacterium]|nr:hypothetical protein [candidate division KSB1 bacterium]
MSKLKLVKNFPNRVAAEQAQAFLQSEAEIQSIVQSHDFGISGAMPRGADVLVEEENFERAFELLVGMFDGI